MNLDSELMKKTLIEVHEAYLHKRVANQDCFADSACFRQCVKNLKEAGLINAEIQDDATRSGGGVHAVITRGLTPVGLAHLKGL